MLSGCLVAGCGSSTPTPAPSPTTPQPTPSPQPASPSRPDAPPVIDSITATPRTGEFRTNSTIEAVVHDEETPNNQLTLEWSTSRGAVTGSGSRVTWRMDQPPLVTSPISIDVTLKVSETIPSGTVQSTSRTVTFTLNDSYKEAQDLANTFLGDFTNPVRSPEFVVRNFSDACAGKRDELGNVQVNRQLFVIDPVKSTWMIGSVTFDGNPPSSRPYGNVRASCTFVSLVKATGQTETAVGICSVDVFFERDRWFLCDSRFQGISVTDASVGRLHP
jgi:hypothetical protein